MRVLIVGGTRFIGPRVIRRLVEGGQQVAVLHRGQHIASLPASVQVFVDPQAGMPVTRFPEAVVRYAPDVVLHMIAMGDRDAAAAREKFVNVAERIVMLSSGDVYRAYGYFSKIEPGPADCMPLTEVSPLRSVLHPYRTETTRMDDLEYYYDKILAERQISSDARLPATILRLPKVYGPGDNADLATVYGFHRHDQWRWTHGFVENVAAAICLAVTDSRARGRTYNVGEPTTPSIRERLAYLPARPDAAQIDKDGHFDQDIVYDTSRIRSELGFAEAVPERQAMIDTVNEYLVSTSGRAKR